MKSASDRVSELVCEKREKARGGDQQIQSGKQIGVEGASELHVERDRDRDEGARETERAEREIERKRRQKREICWREQFLSDSLRLQCVTSDSFCEKCDKIL